MTSTFGGEDGRRGPVAWAGGAVVCVVVGGFAAGLSGAVGATAWVLAGVLSLLAVVCGVLAWRGSASLRRLGREEERRTGYRRGELPGSWAAHAAYLTVPLAFLLNVAPRQLGGDQVDVVLLLAMAVGFGTTAGVAAVSLVQRVRRLGASHGDERAPTVQRGACFCAGLSLVLSSGLNLMPDQPGLARAAGAFGVVVGLAVAAGVAIVWWRDRRQRRTGVDRAEAQR